MVWCDLVGLGQNGMVWFIMVWYGMVLYGLVWFGMVWFGLVWLERTYSTSKVDFHMFWIQARQLCILRTFQGGGGWSRS